MSPPLKTGNPRGACDSVLKPAGSYIKVKQERRTRCYAYVGLWASIIYKYNVPAT